MHSMRLVLSLSFLLQLSVHAIAQNLSNTEANDVYQSGEAAFNRYLNTFTEEDYSRSLDLYQQVVEAYRSRRDTDEVLADSYHKRGILYQIAGDFQSALHEYHQAVGTKKELSQGQQDSLYFKDLILIGNIHYYTDNYDSAEYYYAQANAIAQQFERIYERKRLYNSLGVFYFSLGDYYQALNHYDKAIEALEPSDPDYATDKMRFLNNVALAQLKLGNYQEAIKIYQKLLGDQDKAIPLFYENLGYAYFHKEQYDSSEYYLKKSLHQREISGRLNTLNALGSLWFRRGQVDSAQHYLNQSIELNKEQIAYKNKYLADAYQRLAEVFSGTGNYSEALRYHQQALIANTFNFEEDDITRNPGKEDQPVSIVFQHLILQNKGEAFKKLFQQDQDTTNLIRALHCFQEAIRVARYTQKTYDNEEAKLFFVNKEHSLYEEAISTAYQMYRLSGDDQYAELALKFTENSKASVLTEILREVDIKSSGNVNDSLISEEKRIKQQITANRLKLVESSDSIQNEALHQRLNDLEVALARVVKQLQRDERYYQLKYQDDTFDISTWQSELLGRGDMLLEYFLGENNIYIFALASDALTVHEVIRDSTFAETLQTVQHHLFAYKYGDQYNRQWSYQLYQKLIEPVSGQLEDIDRLIIIPAGELSYLPFELLTPSPQSDTYLLHDYAVSYAFSGSLLYDAHYRRGKRENQKVLAMAPFAGPKIRSRRSNGLSPLYFSRQEVASVGGSLYLEEKATKQLFLKIAGSYNVLHLATHAVVDDENPLQSFVAFYPEDESTLSGYRLYTHELYNLRLDSVNLVVLSSCDAGNGRLVKGEGIISLARAFAYAGCPNIMTTLWKADDKAAAEIASQMHRYLKEGLQKDEALRKAKLDYLQNPRMKELRDPYYWANFVFIGDSAPIYRNYDWLWWLLGGGVLLLTVAIVLSMRRRSPRRQAA